MCYGKRQENKNTESASSIQKVLVDNKDSISNQTRDNVFL